MQTFGVQQRYVVNLSNLLQEIYFYSALTMLLSLIFAVGKQTQQMIKIYL